MTEINKKIFEFPLLNGFRRVIIKTDKNRLISVFYITPKNQCLRNTSDVCEWIEKEKQFSSFCPGNFSFVVRKYTSSEKEYFMDYNSLSLNLKKYLTQRNKSLSDVSMESIDDLSNTPKLIKLERRVAQDDLVSNTGKKLKTTSVIVNDTKTSVKKPKNLLEYFLNIAKKDNDDEIKSYGSINEILSNTSSEKEYFMDYNSLSLNLKEYLTQRNKSLSDVSMESIDDLSNTPKLIKLERRVAQDDLVSNTGKKLKTTSVIVNDTKNSVKKPKNLLEYFLNIANKGNDVEIKSYGSINDILSNTNDSVMKSLKYICDDSCRLNDVTSPILTFKCNLCGLLWHLKCISNTHITLSDTILDICENCFVLEKAININIPNTFYDIEQLISLQHKDQIYINDESKKHELVFKVEWIIRTLNFFDGINYIKEQEVKSLDHLSQIISDVSKELVATTVKKESIYGRSLLKNVDYEKFTKKCKYFFHTFISNRSITRNINEDCILFNYKINDVEKLANLFSDLKCELMIHYQRFDVYTSRIKVVNGKIMIPVEKGIKANRYGLFYMFDNEQYSDSEYIERRDNLKALMCDSVLINSHKKTNLKKLESTSNVFVQLEHRVDVKSIGALEPPHEYISSPMFKDKDFNCKAERNKISTEFKQILVNAHESGENWLLLGKHLGIKESSVFAIINRWRKSRVISKGKRGGYKKKIISSEIEKSLLLYLEENNLATLEQMKDFICNNHQLTLSVSTISNFLEGKCISLKAVRGVTDDQNSQDIKERRYNYVKNIIEYELFKQSIYIEESEFNIWLKRSRGKGIKERRFRTCHGQSGRNISICIAISNKGIMHYNIIVGSFNRIKYQKFIDELSSMCQDKEVNFIMDNSRIEYSISVENPRHTIIFLPPCSQFLNPVEAVFNALKWKVKSIINDIVTKTKMTAQSRHEFLECTIKETVLSMYSMDFRDYYRHCASYHSKCIEKEDILGD